MLAIQAYESKNIYANFNEAKSIASVSNVKTLFDGDSRSDSSIAFGLYNSEKARNKAIGLAKKAGVAK